MDIENATSRSTSALTETIQVPFHEGHVFSPDGWQAVLYDVRDTTKLLAERHSEFASTIERTVVRDLEQVRTNIKNQIHLVEKEASIVADEVEKEVRLLDGLDCAARPRFDPSTLSLYTARDFEAPPP